MWLCVCVEPAVPTPSLRTTHLFSVTNRSFLPSFLLCPLTSLPVVLQLRKDASSLSAPQSGGSPAAPTPADAPRLLESAAAGEEGEAGCPEGKVDGEAEEEAPKGAPLARETAAKQDGVCG